MITWDWREFLRDYSVFGLYAYKVYTRTENMFGDPISGDDNVRESYRYGWRWSWPMHQIVMMPNATVWHRCFKRNAHPRRLHD